MAAQVSHKARRTLLGIVTTSLILAGGYVIADCNSYSNSRIVYVGADAYCGDTGTGCTECTDAGGGSCVTNGESCQPFTKD